MRFELKVYRGLGISKSNHWGKGKGRVWAWKEVVGIVIKGNLLMKLLSILTLIVKTQTYKGDKIIIEVNTHCKCTCTHLQMSTNKIWEIRT